MARRSVTISEAPPPAPPDEKEDESTARTALTARDENFDEADRAVEPRRRRATNRGSLTATTADVDLLKKDLLAVFAAMDPDGSGKVSKIDLYGAAESRSRPS